MTDEKAVNAVGAMKPFPRSEAEEKYMTDPKFNRIVMHLANLLRDGMFTEKDLWDAVKLSIGLYREDVRRNGPLTPQQED